MLCLTNHNGLGQLANQSMLGFSEGAALEQNQNQF